ncbi:hypothetical protein V5799_005108 [Amblyomma americanum]|uniref:Uncharacterized protein n=1 Tax=Amblyomma americanum TaxID=6943 RepID=A0AAQ4E076_AMBAM
MTATTRVECWMATVGVLLSSVGFFCVCLGLSYRFLVVTLVGYVMAPVGVVVFVAFLFVYQTSRRLQCQAATSGEESVVLKCDRSNSESGPGEMPMVVVRTTNGKASGATETVVVRTPDVISDGVNNLRDSHV